MLNYIIFIRDKKERRAIMQSYNQRIRGEIDGDVIETGHTRHWFLTPKQAIPHPIHSIEQLGFVYNYLDIEAISLRITKYTNW